MRCFADLDYRGAILKAMRDLTKTIIDQLKKCLGYLNEPYRKDDSSTADRRSASCHIRHSPNGVFGSEFVRNGVSLCCVLGAKERDGEPPTDYRLLRAIQVNQSIHSAALASANPFHFHRLSRSAGLVFGAFVVCHRCSERSTCACRCCSRGSLRAASLPTASSRCSSA
jgi:hypothetical protein